MGRHVVIEFDDAEAADRFIAKIEQATKQGKKFRVAGLFGFPTSWCTCPAPLGYHKNELVIGAKFGWWTHIYCKKPSMTSHQAKNLYPAEKRSLPDTPITNMISTLNTYVVFTTKVKRED